MGPETEIARCLRREVEELKASATSTDSIARDGHFAMAERYADRAWSLQEARDNPDLDQQATIAAAQEHAATIVTLSSELLKAFGPNALEVALAQSATATPEGVDTWFDIVSHFRANGIKAV